ncbi:hypothetical protein [Paenibacillus bovis]|uniref:hypothetical protein n=1 Tax=Paenibacillus bovis TaxID=1616788 RepID=UPI000AC2DC7E|nr:hypothetical protein [Paenibacillus bovis]
MESDRYDQVSYSQHGLFVTAKGDTEWPIQSQADRRLNQLRAGPHRLSAGLKRLW